MFGLSIETRTASSHPHQKIINLGIGEPGRSLFPAETLKQIMDLPQVHHYYPPGGNEDLRSMISRRYYDPGIGIENILITHGGIGALDLIFRNHLQPEDEVLLPNPYFPPYKPLVEGRKARVLYYSVLEDRINWALMEKSITEKTKFILLNSPHNPTGRILDQQDLVQLENLLHRYPGLSFILDEVYRDIIYDNQNHIDLSLLKKRGFLVGSFSKCFPLQGARIGWVMSASENLDLIAKTLAYSFGSISSFSQEMAKTLLSHNYSFSNHYAKARNLTTHILDSYQISYIKPQGAFFVFIYCQGRSSHEVATDLEGMGVKTIPGHVFGENGNSFIRASFAQDDQDLIRGFHRIGQYFEQNKKNLQKKSSIT